MDKIANTKREIRVFQSRVVIAVLFIFALSLVLISRIYSLQIIEYDYYSEEALGNQLQQLPITPARGDILDRNGKILATNTLSYKLTITPEKVKDMDATIVALKRFDFINDDDIEQFYKIKKRYKKFHNIPIKHNVSEQAVAIFLTKARLPGVEIEPYFHRVYPNDASSSHLIGYVSSMNQNDKDNYDKDNYAGTTFVGKTGIEKQYENLLHGNSGIKQIERNVSGRVVDSQILIPAESGQDLYLSIDLDLQLKAEELMNGKRGALVMVDVTDGSILALVSMPTFNPNWFVGGISSKQYQTLQKDKNLPLFDRSIKGLYPPGSTIKPMVALGGLEQKDITVTSKVFCPGYYKISNYSRKFNDWKRTGHGHVDVESAIAQSCDVFFYDLAFNMGIDKLHVNLAYFQFGEKTGIDLPGEFAGILPSREWKKINKDEPWYRGETLNTGIGQGFMTASPLRLAVATAAIANKGQLPIPQILMHSQTSTGRVELRKNLGMIQIPIKDIKNWEAIIAAMEQTVYGSSGTARRLNHNLSYTLAGKTGTAQVFGLDPEETYIAENYEEKLRDHALFTGFAPVENPQVAIAIIVENAGSGSSKAAPIAKAVLDVYFVKNPVTPLATVE